MTSATAIIGRISRAASAGRGLRFMPEEADQGSPLHDWTKTTDLFPPPLDSVLGRWIARREHHIVIHNPDWSERDEDGSGRTWRVFRPNDDTGEPIDPPDYWQHLTLPRAEFDPLGEGAA